MKRTWQMTIIRGRFIVWRENFTAFRMEGEIDVR